MQTKKKNKKGQGRKPDPSKAVNFRFKLADYELLLQKHGKGKGIVSAALKKLALSDLHNNNEQLLSDLLFFAARNNYIKIEYDIPPSRIIDEFFGSCV